MSIHNMFWKQLSLYYILALMFYLTLEEGWTYPEMVRHGYTNCTACHVSPSGGGVLTQYGRELSREILSQTSNEDESNFAYGLLKPPEWLNLGGDIRTLVLYRDTPTAREGSAFIMQADLEAAIAYKKMFAAGTVGGKAPPTPQPIKDYIISRRHYVGVRPTDEISFRAGKFQHAFGINTPDHAIATKRGLGWDQNTETYNLEGAYLGENLNTYATAVFGRPDAKELKRETGASISSSVGFWDRYKAGLSYYYGTNSISRRHVFGPFGILGFTPSFSLLTELDFTQRGFGNYEKIDYEFIQGFHGFLTQEFSKSKFNPSLSLNKTSGIGIQYFPRPHFELSLTYQVLIVSGLSGYTELLFFLFHFYP